MERAAVVGVILDTARAFNQELDYRIDVSRGENTPLFGAGGVLDSLGLVSFITAIEQALDERLGAIAVLADERAFSQSRSPFMTVATLADYILSVAALES
jgi:acyl carrier protein